MAMKSHNYFSFLVAARLATTVEAFFNRLHPSASEVVERPAPVKRRVRVSAEGECAEMPSPQLETPNSRCGFATGESPRL
ncbi:hypothetical protein [Pelodictyon luteolum]|uniref:hypothetical protein n=1 Tax=Pelodictyon luteolum TaxID=1100 RepID=UPI00059E804F|nr:hypothetical protein [Pelodictyon luteolum]